MQRFFTYATAYNSFYLKSILRYKILIFYIYHLSLYLRGQECEHSWLFFEAKMGPRPRKLGKHCLKGMRVYGN